MAVARKGEPEEGRPLPPYISFKTLQSFVQKLKETTVPQRVDQSLLRTYSGSVGRKLVAALRFLGLTENGGRTTEKLDRLVKSYGTPEWSVALSEVLTDAYKDVTGNLNLQNATPAQLEERFKAWGAQGAALSACVAFYVAALRNAGVALSPHILNRARGRAERARGRARRARTNNDTAVSPGVQDTVPPADAAGTVRFSFPIPDKPVVTLFLPKELESEDWNMIDSMVRAYIARREKAA